MPVLEKAWFRWGLAVLLIALAAAVNGLLQPVVNGRAPLLPFFPALMAVGLLCGLGPAVCALLASAAIVATWSVEPIGKIWPIDRASDVVLMVSFLTGGSFAIAVSSYARRLLTQYRQTNARLNMTLSVGRMTTWEWEVPSGGLKLAPGAEHVFGIRWRVADDMWLLLDVHDQEQARGIVNAALTGTADNYSFLGRYARPDTHEVRWIESFGKITRNETGRAIRVNGVSVDVDERQRLLEVSRAAEDRFDVALKGSGIFVWECDLDLRYTWVRNPQASFKPEDYLGRDIVDLLPSEQAAKVTEAAHRALRDDKAQTIEVDLPRDGKTRFYLWTVGVRTDDKGSAVGFIGASMDITDLKVTQLALEQEARRKDDFLATLAHELRNPMAPIRYAAALLGRPAPEAAKEHARTVIERQSGHISQLLDDLLDMSRLTRNTIQLQRTRVDVRECIRQALENAQPQFGERRQYLSVAIADEPLWVLGDATRLLQIFGNLLDNAAKYTPRDGEIGVVVERRGTRAVIAIRDTGIGLMEEERAGVFELFVRAQRPGQPDPGGLGVGLAIVKQLVDLHGGTVHAESEGIGKGSKFVVELPLDIEATTAAPAPPRSPVVPLMRRHAVLVVDDNRDAADMLASSLRLQGYAVSVAYDGTTALDAQERVKPAAVLLDLGLPDLSGHEVARRIRRQPGPTPKLIAISGWAQEADLRDSADAGFDAHLVKPTTADEVHLALQGLIKPSAGVGDASAR